MQELTALREQRQALTKELLTVRTSMERGLSTITKAIDVNDRHAMTITKIMLTLLTQFDTGTEKL